MTVTAKVREEGISLKALSKDELHQLCKEHGIHFRRFTEDEFVMTVNMMYADYCEAVGASDIAVYIKMAKAFLEDPDARVDGGEKLAIYYECFVE